MTTPAPAKKNSTLVLILVIVGGVIFICIGCTVFSAIGQAVGIIPTLTPVKQDVAAITTSVYQTIVANLPPTETPQPGPTATPLPTETPVPSETPTPLPQPIVLNGAGDNIVDVQKWEGPAILKATYNGGGNFAIKSYSPANKPIDLLVNTIGAYSGTVPIDFLASEQTSRLEITASAQWDLQIIPLQQARKETIPGTLKGSGDEVVILMDASPDLLKIDASQATSNFAILAYSKTDRDLLVNEIAPYSGTVMAQPGTVILVITATGPWSIEVTTR